MALSQIALAFLMLKTSFILVSTAPSSCSDMLEQEDSEMRDVDTENVLGDVNR